MRLKSQMDAQTKRTVARRVLLDKLEMEFSGQLKNAELTFDQEVQYKIALSLTAISDRLERMADKGMI